MSNNLMGHRLDKDDFGHNATKIELGAVFNMINMNYCM